MAGDSEDEMPLAEQSKHQGGGGGGVLWFGLASFSTGRCSGPSTLFNVVGKRNLNGCKVYLR